MLAVMLGLTLVSIHIPVCTLQHMMQFPRQAVLDGCHGHKPCGVWGRMMLLNWAKSTILTLQALLPSYLIMSANCCDGSYGDDALYDCSREGERRSHDDCVLFQLISSTSPGP